jgi:hypothetical protein
MTHRSVRWVNARTTVLPTLARRPIQAYSGCPGGSPVVARSGVPCRTGDRRHTQAEGDDPDRLGPSLGDGLNTSFGRTFPKPTPPGFRPAGSRGGGALRGSNGAQSQQGGGGYRVIAVMRRLIGPSSDGASI